MMRGMFRRKLKDFAEQQQDNHDEVPMVERLKFKRLKEEDDDEKAKREFRRKIMGNAAKQYNEDNYGSNQQLLMQNPPDLRPVGIGGQKKGEKG